MLTMFGKSKGSISICPIFGQNCWKTKELGNEFLRASIWREKVRSNSNSGEASILCLIHWKFVTDFLETLIYLLFIKSIANGKTICKKIRRGINPPAPQIYNTSLCLLFGKILSINKKKVFHVKTILKELSNLVSTFIIIILKSVIFKFKYRPASSL